jgi:hypothetical protein
MGLKAGEKTWEQERVAQEHEKKDEMKWKQKRDRNGKAKKQGTKEIKPPYDFSVLFLYLYPRWNLGLGLRPVEAGPGESDCECGDQSSRSLTPYTSSGTCLANRSSGITIVWMSSGVIGGDIRCQSLSAKAG